MANPTIARSPTTTSTKPPFLPPRWVIRSAWRIHRALYRLSGKRFGLRLPTSDQGGLMHVTTLGRSSGLPREVMLAYIEDGPNLVTMAMNGWGEGEPAWWRNLQSSPGAEVELADRKLRVLARAATADEQRELWARYATIEPKLDGYDANRQTPTPVVILEPIS